MSAPLWGECNWLTSCKPSTNESDDDVEGEVEVVEARVPINNDLNQQTPLYHGNSHKVPCSIIVMGQNEALHDHNDNNDPIYILAGPEFGEELSAAAPAQTGDSTIVKA
jgi:hypothetical protein